MALFERKENKVSTTTPPLSIDRSFTSSYCALYFETPISISLKDEQVQAFLTPTPIEAKTERHIIATSTTRTNIVKTSKYLLSCKRKRPCYRLHSALPPMIPGSPELYGTVDSNPFRRHVAIHSPIAGIGGTLNLGFIGKIKSSESYDRQQIQLTLVPQQYPIKMKRHKRTSSSSSNSSSSFDESKRIDRVKIFLPVLEDPYKDNDMNFDERNQGKHDIFSITSKPLKIRRRCTKYNPLSTFDTTGFII